MVARPVKPAEVKQNPAAYESMRVDYGRLAGKCWNHSTVREWSAVSAEARHKDAKVHIASVFGVCVEKNSELEPAHRKFKGRYVLQGNFVTDEYREAAVFQALSSSPATLEASKIIDAIGLMPGNGIQQADAEQAYAQAEMPASATPVWLRLPKEFRPKHLDGKSGPVVLMERALYGHPDSGGHLEQH